MATTRGPLRVSHSPPSTDVQPRKNQLIVKGRVTCGMVQPYSFDSGIRNTLHAYPAPSAICMQTPATAIHPRLTPRIHPPLRYPKIA